MNGFSCLLPKENVESLKDELPRECLSDEHFMKSYPYKISPWPVVIDSKIKSELDEVVNLLPSIINKVLRFYLNENAEFLEWYINESPLTLYSFKESQFERSRIMVRYDAVYCDSGFKVFELNVGASIGGWQPSLLRDSLKAFLYDNDVLQDLNLEFRNILQDIFSSMSKVTTKEGVTIGSPTLAIMLKDVPMLENVKAVFREVFISAFPNNEIIFFESYKELELVAPNDVRINSKRVDVIMCPDQVELTADLKEKSWFQNFAKNTDVYFPDCTNHTLLSNKLILALLHEEGTKAALSEDELRIVQKVVPKTWKIHIDKRFHAGYGFNLEQFVIDNQYDLLIKKSNSRQGKDVIIGRKVSSDYWYEQFTQLRSDNDWLLQWYERSNTYTLAEPALGKGEYELVWGIFGIAGGYCGSWCRGARVENNSGIINSAQGAVEFLVAEEKYKKRKIIL